MAISLGSLAGAYTQARSAFDDSKGEASVKEFIGKLGQYGVGNSAMFEVNFSGIPDVTFFIRSISVPNVKQNVGNLYWEARQVEIPINFEKSHDFTLQVLNDGKGYIYQTLHNWIVNNNLGESAMESGYTLVLRALGDGQNTDGMTVTFTGCRFKDVGALNYDYSAPNVSTFNVQMYAVDFDVTMGKVQKLGGILGAIDTASGGVVSGIRNSLGKFGI